MTDRAIIQQTAGACNVPGCRGGEIDAEDGGVIVCDCATIRSMGEQMTPEVRAAKVEQCHQDGLLKFWGRLQGRVWLYGAEPDTLAVIKVFHFLRSKHAGEVISSQQFRVITVPDILQHTMTKGMSINDLVDEARVLIVRVQNDVYPSTVCQMILQALRIRDSRAGNKTTWLVTDSKEPECLTDKAGWTTLLGYLNAAFPAARAPRGSSVVEAPKGLQGVRSADRKGKPVPWHCFFCKKRYEPTVLFHWADSVGMHPDKGKKACPECFDQFSKDQTPLP